MELGDDQRRGGGAARAGGSPASPLLPMWFAWVVACLLSCVGQVAAAAPAAGADSAYFMTTSQLADPLRPFAHLPKGASVKVKAAVIALPDPLETRLGRAFDVELSAVISAFQANGYALDGFALAWAPRDPDKDGGYPAIQDPAREWPGVLLFRRDNWRNCHATSGAQAFCGSTYYALFVVGETPTSGVHPDAFRVAARCAMLVDGMRSTASTTADIASVDCHDEETRTSEAANPGAPDDMDARLAGIGCDRQLDIIGPSFSGSMESMAAALGNVAKAAATSPCIGSGPKQLRIRLVSPSASVSNNEEIKYHDYLAAADSPTFKVAFLYRPLAYSVSDQMDTVMAYLEPRLGADGTVVVLSEESSFGEGARDDLTSNRLGEQNAICTRRNEAAQGEPHCWGHLVSVQFPPNIAAIRAEHVKLKQGEDAQRKQFLPERLLELDLTGVDKGTDQPPTYQPSLSSRSDELMLYQTFDALKKYVRPAAVIVIATDVRDRLFLLSEIRDLLPGSLPIVLEQDNLLAHPDYRDISRGSITMPAGQSLVCLNTYNDPIPCPQGEGTKGFAAAGKDTWECPLMPRHFAFATDYAANTFRAATRLAKLQDLPADQQHAFTDPDSAWMAPPMLVATLAGFQYADIQSKRPVSATAPNACKVTPAQGKQDILIVADTRIQLQEPVYLGMMLFFTVMLAVACWLTWNGRDISLVSFPVCRHALRWMRVTPSTTGSARHTSSGWLFAWLLFALAGLAIAGGKVITMLPPPSYGDTNLAHGRDLWALIALCLGYACFVAFAALRVLDWNAHCLMLAQALEENSRFGTRLRQLGHWHAAAGALILLICLPLSVNDMSPTSTEHPWISELSGVLALCGSAFFLVLLAETFDRWRRTTLELAKVIPLVREKTGLADWPTPCLLDERPRSPFNIVMRSDNYDAWRRQPLSAWTAQTRSLLDRTWPFGAEGPPFDTWQAQLVAEMKLAAAAVRTCAWCAVLGATLALMLMQVYPPVYPRLQTTAATILLALSFAAIVYAVLQLEKDALLGRMFTDDKDHLTLGGALTALWPKLLAFGSILVMVFLPSAWDWLGGMVKAVNTLH
ncbi:MAG TPA: hypothetical protein VFG49_13260 [Dyella sp.]|uniref:hypothetical protein n=1 Tax=Dyella sp. TaxID=1869338 RepID=UPI002D78C167|nr:hypothetical protein [Dyella sp.]HET6554488.1 hypothetical protein [Dyella sp.]